MELELDLDLVLMEMDLDSNWNNFVPLQDLRNTFLELYTPCLYCLDMARHTWSWPYSNPFRNVMLLFH